MLVFGSLFVFVFKRHSNIVSEELTPKMPCSTPPYCNPVTLDANEMVEVAVAEDMNEEEGDDISYGRTSPSGRRVIRDILQDNYPLATSSRNDEYTIDVENLLKDDNSALDPNKKYGR